MSATLKLLQFGATGQVAREVIARAESRGMSVQALSRQHLDLADTAAIVEAIRRAPVDLVINAAAYTAVDRAESEEPLAFVINADAPRVMARTCAERQLPLIHISTDYVFGGRGERPWRESDRTSPANAYGRSKAAGEAAIAAEAVRAIVLRTSWVFSPYGNNFVKTMLDVAKIGRPLRVVDDQRGRPTAAGDLANCLLTIAPRLASGDREATGLFHFAGEGPTTWRGFAEAIFELAGGPRPEIVPITTADYPTVAKRPLNSVLDCYKLERVFSIRPRPWRDGLAETLRQLSDAPEAGS